MRNLIAADSHYSKYISIQDKDFKGRTGALITLHVPWHVAEQLAIIVGPFLKVISDVVDTRTMKEAEQAARESQRQTEETASIRQKRIFMLRMLKRVYREGIHYYDFQDAVQFGLFFHKKDLHKLYHDARASKAWQMREKGHTRQEIGDFFGVKKPAVSNIINRAKDLKKRKSHLPVKDCG